MSRAKIPYYSKQIPPTRMDGLKSIVSLQMKTAKIKPDKSKFETRLNGSKSFIVCKQCGSKAVFDNNINYKENLEKIISPFKKSHEHGT